MSTLEEILKYIPQSVKNAGVCCLLTATLSFSDSNAVKAEEEITEKQLQEIAQQVDECYRVYAKNKGESFIEHIDDASNLIGWYRGLNPLSEKNKKLMKSYFKEIISKVGRHFGDKYEYVSFFVGDNLLEYHPYITIMSLDKEEPLTPWEKRIKAKLLEGTDPYIETGNTLDGSEVYLVGKSMQSTPSCMICHESTPKGALVFVLPKDKIGKLDFKPETGGGGY